MLNFLQKWRNYNTNRMLIDEAKYNWLRTNPIEILVEDNSNNIEFEKALYIYHIEGATELSMLLAYLINANSTFVITKINTSN